MRRRHAKRGRIAGRDFWSCTHWPFCRGTRDDDLSVPDYVQVLAAQRRSDIAAAIASDNPRCPWCDSVMLERVNRRGSSRGYTFWGCSRYPDCDGIRKTDGTESSTEEEIRWRATIAEFLDQVGLCTTSAELRALLDARSRQAASEHWRFLTNFWWLAAGESPLLDASLLIDVVRELPPRVITEAVCAFPAMSKELAEATLALLSSRAREARRTVYGTRDLLDAFERLSLVGLDHPLAVELNSRLAAEKDPLFMLFGPESVPGVDRAETDVEGL